MKQFARLLEEAVPDVDRYQDIAMEKIKKKKTVS